MSLRHDVAPTDVATIPLIGNDAAGVADQLIAFARLTATGKHEVVAELRDAHRNLLARSVVATVADPERIADELMAESPLERCSDFIVDPLGKKKTRRSVASVAPRVNAVTSRYEQARSSAPPMAI